MCSTLHICKRAHRLEHQSGTFRSFIVAQHSGFPSWFCLIRRVTCWQTRHGHHVHWCHLKISPKNSEIYRIRSTLSIGICGCIFFHDQHSQMMMSMIYCSFCLFFLGQPAPFALWWPCEVFQRGYKSAATTDVQSLLFESCGNAYRISTNKLPVQHET